MDGAKTEAVKADTAKAERDQQEFQRLYDEILRKAESPAQPEAAGQEKSYTSNVIYQCKVDLGAVRAREKHMYIYVGIWSSLAALSFFFVSRWLSILPVWFLSGHLLSIRSLRNYSRKLVTHLKLSDDKEQVTLLLPMNPKVKEIVARVADLKWLSSHELVDPEDKKVKSFVLLFSATDLTGRVFPELRLFIEPGAKVENMDLLLAVLTGNTAEAAAFTLKPAPTTEETAAPTKEATNDTPQ